MKTNNDEGICGNSESRVGIRTYNFLNSLAELPVELLFRPEHAFYVHFMYDLLFHKRSGLL